MLAIGYSKVYKKFSTNKLIKARNKTNGAFFYLFYSSNTDKRSSGKIIDFNEFIYN